MRVRIVPYKIGSQSAKLLAQELGYLRCNPLATRFKPRFDDLIINWGYSGWPFNTRGIVRGKILNHPEDVRVASNKVSSLRAMDTEGVSVVPFTTDYTQAKRWFEEDENVYVYERHTTNGHGGAGITICHSPDLLTRDCKLYTKGIPIRREYRVHVFNRKVIDHIQKRKRLDAPDTNAFIRNHTNGWVFVREGFDRLEEVERQAIAAVKALGLDFGAVDIIVEKYTGNTFVLEVNTAPGIMGTTLQAYVDAIKEYIDA